MCLQGPAPPIPQEGRRSLELADIFREHGATFLAKHRLTPDQRKAFDAIIACRTPVLGGNVDVCAACGHVVLTYNSCRNRHCPKCQSLNQGRWIEQRKERILATHYFHVVFTLPASLRPLARRNPEAIYNLLFQAAARTLLELGRDPERLGAQLGITAVLHTWTRELAYHPHLHCIVSGGGLAPEGDRWIPARRRFLFPRRVLSALFRGKFLAGLDALYRGGELALGGACEELADPIAFARFRDRLYQQDWVVYAKRPFGGPANVFAYLGRYTHRVGISNQRLLAMDECGITFATKGGRTATLAPVEFIRRWLHHVLPTGFVKIRHYGLAASTNVETKLAVAQRLLATSAPRAESSPTPAPLHAAPWQQLLAALTGIDPRLCPRCGGPMIRTRVPALASRPPLRPRPRDTS